MLFTSPVTVVRSISSGCRLGMPTCTILFRPPGQKVKFPMVDPLETASRKYETSEEKVGREKESSLRNINARIIDLKKEIILNKQQDRFDDTTTPTTPTTTRALKERAGREESVCITSPVSATAVMLLYV
eukprot:GHVS01065769.1.p2 GENE.GHVS01065769.1~~GHVS01065769.1.p2  ORF type:complete len:130 (+),score=23.85 GHVS01065769.1:372-761(+)